MTRYDFMLYHRDVPAFLDSLRELGLVDITLKDFEATEEQKAKFELSTSYAQVAKELSSIAPSGEKFESLQEAVEAYQRAKKRVEEIDSKRHSLNLEREKVKAWGEFDSKAIDELKSQGVVLRFFEIPSKNYRLEWEHIYATSLITHHNGSAYFVIAASGEDITKPLEINAVEVAAPVRSASEIELEVEKLLAQEVEQRAVIARAAQSLDELKDRVVELNEDIDYLKVLGSAESDIDGTIKILEGWSESDRRADIEKFANEADLYYTAEEATAEQNPPIKLKNNFFARLFEPIGAIYMYPRYNELDLTLFFAPFFMIFFGMCLGDAGYGILLMGATIAMWNKIPQGYKDFGWLSLFLNFSAVIFGVLSGNVFGIALVSVEAFVEFKEFFLSPNDIFYLSIGLGAIQVFFGILLRTFNRIKRGGSFLYGISNIGWLILIASSATAFSGLVPAEVYGTDTIAYKATLYFAVALILLFSVPKKPFASIGKGLYSFYETITGVIGDLISYVRLFAIGLAGAIIAQVFNELAVGLSGDIPVVSFIVMAIILFIGHGLNIFISILGAIVHPIRLTFVEFYKNAEFEGGGRLFTPFKRKNR